MAFCQQCGSQLAEGGTFCAVCGTPVAQAAQPEPTPAQQPAAPYQPEPAPVQQPAPNPYQPEQAPVQQNPYQPVPQYQPVQPTYNPNDHTADFTAEDISKNKVVAMAAYVLGMIGIVIALLAAPESPYASFHSRQALKLEIVSQLLLIVSLVLCFTFIVPILGALALVVVFVVRIICFFQVCSGKAKDAAIVGSLPFLK
ncbi:MAG: zinc ribbon domain-containing protein [Hominenteromicrobium sp.]